MEHRMCIRIPPDGQIKCLEYQRIIVTVADNIRDDSSVIQIQDRTKIDLMFFSIYVILELCNICQPFLVRRLRFKVSS